MPAPHLLPPEQPEDGAAFEALFRLHHTALSSFAWRYVRSGEVAEDLVQEVFLYIWEHRVEWPEPAAARAYLFRAVRNACLSHLRHEGVKQRTERDVIDIFSRHTAIPDRKLQDTEFTDALNRAVEQMPERRRMTFLLSREQGLSYAEIAEVMEISPKTVEVQMGLAYKTLRRILAPHWR